MKKSIFLSLLIACTIHLVSENKQIKAFPAEEKIIIDGELSESVWQSPGFSNFIQNEPQNGEQPSEKTEIWVVYDARHFYIAARLSDSEPDKIISRLGRHDDMVESDWFTVALDPYFDRLSGYEFSVNPAGSRIDAQLSSDIMKNYSWDGIWQAAAKITDQGWQVEIAIPFSELRFQKASEYVWGIDCRRLIKRKQERVGIVFLPKNESGYVSRFATLTGIKEIKVSSSHHFTPYFSPRAEFLADEKNSLQANYGADFKISLKSNLILNLSLNPDFGQVEVDPAEINLSGFETFLAEKRPFFLEGASIFNFGQGGISSSWNFGWQNPVLFYSRRIGRSPRLYPQDYSEIIYYPDFTNIIAAAKVSGKVFNNFNLGALSAFTSRQKARFILNGEELAQTVEPAASYNVLRFQQEFNSGSRSIGLIFTSAFNFNKDEFTAEQLPEKSIAIGIDSFLKFGKNQSWALLAWLAYSEVSGSSESIANLQQSRPHYFQKPDFPHLNFDPEKKLLSGWSSRLVVNKEKGSLIFNTSIGLISPGFNVNSLGFLSRTDLLSHSTTIGLRKNNSQKFLRYWNLSASLFLLRNFNFDNLDNGGALSFFAETKTNWNFHFMAYFSGANLNPYLTRGGISLYEEAGHFFHFNITSDNRKKFVYGLEAGQDKNYNGSFRYNFDIYFRYKISSNIDLTFSPEYSWGRNTRM